MDVNSVLNEVVSWPVEVRLRLMDEIWEGILDQGKGPELTDQQKAELARRVADDDAAPDDVVAWKEVKAAALRRAGR